jgi:hypothetical protein
MESLESREMFKFDTRFRVLPRNFGVYDGQKVFDVEEIIVATDTLPFADYITCREWHLMSSVFWNDGWFENVVRFARAMGISNSDWWSAMLPAMRNGTPAVRAFLAEFVQETQGELFTTRQACIDFYSIDENFDRLRRGEIGDNLMYRYRAIASFFVWDEICACAMNATKQLLIERGAAAGIPDFETFWDEFSSYVRCQHASGRTREEILADCKLVMRHDIGAWLASGELTRPSDFRLPQPAEFAFRLTDEGARELGAALSVWTLHIRGLSKMVTRINVDWQVRRCTHNAAMAAA